MCLANAKLSEIRYVAINMLVSTLKYTLRPIRQLESPQESQLTLFESFHELLKSIQQSESRKYAIECVRKIIQDHGTDCTKLTWIKIVSMLIDAMRKDKPEEVALIFGSVQIIIVDHLHVLEIDKIMILSNLLPTFMGNNIEINITLTAINLYPKISDYLRALKDQSHEQNLSIIQSFFNNLKGICHDKRMEVRSAAIKTIANILVDNNDIINDAIWKEVLYGILLKLLNSVVKQITTSKKEVHLSPSIYTTDTPTPSFQSTSKKEIRFEENHINTELWEETYIDLVIEMCRLIKTYFLSKNKCDNFLMDVYSGMMSNSMTMIGSGHLDIQLNSFRIIVMLDKPCIPLMMNRFDITWGLYKEFLNWLLKEKAQVEKNGRTLNNKITPIISEGLQIIYNASNQQKDVILSGAIIFELFSLSKQLMNLSKMAQGGSALCYSNILLSEEKNLFLIIESISGLISTQEQYTNYYNCLISMISFDASEPHSEPISKKVMEIIYEQIKSTCIPISVLTAIIPTIFKQLMGIICLRYKLVETKSMFFTAKESTLLWMDAGNKLISIAKFLLRPTIEPKLTKPVDDTNIKKEATFEVSLKHLKSCSSMSKVNKKSLKIVTGAIDSDELTIRQSQSLASPNYLEELSSNIAFRTQLWKSLLSITKDLLIPNTTFSTDKAIVDEVIKRSQELNILILDLLLNVMLVSSQGIEKEYVNELIAIIEGIGFNSISYSGLSTYCLENLFSLCNYNEANSKFNVAPIVTPILLNKCRALICKFIDDERKNGLTPMPKQQLNEMLFILGKLKGLRICPPNDSEGTGVVDFRRTYKSHLYMLMPELSECITTKEPDIKAMLKDIFNVISDDLGLRHKE